MMIGALGYGGMTAAWQQYTMNTAARGAAEAAPVSAERETLPATVNAPVAGAVIGAASAALAPSELPYVPEGYGPEELAARTRLQFPDLGTPLSNALEGKLAGAENELEQTGVDGVEGESPAETVEEAECETCKNRQYQDGSDDPGVSFKTATKLSPDEAASAVRSHEQEHVVRERAKAAREDRKVVSQSVTIHTSVCPECGRVYVSGGVTRTVTAPDESKADQESKGSQTPESLQSTFEASA